MIIFWQLKHGDKIAIGWCHNQPAHEAIKAVMYQSGLSYQELKDTDSKVSFRYRNAIDLGTYYFDCDEFYPSSIYDDGPDFLANVQL